MTAGGCDGLRALLLVDSQLFQGTTWDKAEVWTAARTALTASLLILAHPRPRPARHELWEARVQDGHGEWPELVWEAAVPIKHGA
jgi:hypothetical protein